MTSLLLTYAVLSSVLVAKLTQTQALADLRSSRSAQRHTLLALMASLDQPLTTQSIQADLRLVHLLPPSASNTSPSPSPTTTPSISWTHALFPGLFTRKGQNPTKTEDPSDQAILDCPSLALLLRR